jgi:molecular chaperone DnaJ
MAKRDYYEILEIDKSSSPEEIKKAYRKQALKYHPDRNKNDKTAEAKFKEAGEAYHVLSDKERRSTYNQFGHAAFDGASGRGGFSNFDFSSTFSDIFGSDIFDDFFEDFGGTRSGKQRRSANQRGAELLCFPLLVPPKSSKKSSNISDPNMSENVLEKSKFEKPPLPDAPSKAACPN